MWVLIILYFSSSTSSAVVQEFSGQQACQVAQEWVMTSYDEYMSGMGKMVRASCFPK
jgi:hypothetical protein